MPTLDWLNRANAFTIANKVPYRLLEQVSTHGAPATDNLLIQGDNLEALKALLPFYRGQVKCIFIDPPYNTKSAFEHYDDNLEHAQWLSMMLPRLQLLRELLREDGSIWVTIDDNEGHYLKVLMDEVFGRGNFIANVVWQKAYGPRSNAFLLSDSHDHVLVYGRKKEVQSFGLLSRSDAQTAKYKNLDGDSRGPWKPENASISLLSGQRGKQYAKTGKSENVFEIFSPTGIRHMPPKNRCWAFSPKRYAELVADGRIGFGTDGSGRPSIKKFLAEISQGVIPQSVWLHDEVGHNQESSREIRELFDESPFATPKPERLISRILHLASGTGDLILDSFLGSGTTAAVAHKMGRRWIGIEMGEHAATHCLPRLQKVIDGEQGGISKAVGWGESTLLKAWNGGGFRFMRLGETVFDDAGRINPAVRFNTLAAFIWQQETNTAFDATAAQAGTPYLGTCYEINSELLNKSESQVPILPIDGPKTASGTLNIPKMSIYLLFNGILGDKRPASGNVLTRDVLTALLNLHAQLAPANTPLIVYGESVRVGPARLAAAQVTFKQIPYDVRAR